jgi:hypothetical protein
MTMRRGISRRDFLAGTAAASAALLTGPGGKRPDPEAIFTNRFAGKIKLATSEWNDVRARLSEFDKYLS